MIFDPGGSGGLGGLLGGLPELLQILVKDITQSVIFCPGRLRGGWETSRGVSRNCYNSLLKLLLKVSFLSREAPGGLGGLPGDHPELLYID